MLELGRLLAAGWLSTVYAITSRRAGPFPARTRDVGVTVDLATHHVDILSWIAGQRRPGPRGERSGSKPTTRTSYSGSSTSRPASSPSWT